MPRRAALEQEARAQPARVREAQREEATVKIQSVFRMQQGYREAENERAERQMRGVDLRRVSEGVAAAIRPNSLIDRLALFLSVMGQALPSFWFALMLIVFLSVNLRLLPTSGSDTWLHFVMPTVVLGYYAAPAIMRLTRTGMLEVLSTDYIRTARAKGLRPWVVLFKHALRNAIIPVVSLAAVQFGFMLGGSIVVETIFALHGAGFLAWESITRNDLPTVQGLILVFSLFYIVLTFFADLLNAWLDPRIRIN